MSLFIDLVETFNFCTLTSEKYDKKIDGLLKRFPKYEKDDRFRSVLPEKFPKTVDDYISMKFCTIGRFPVYGIYNRRDLDLVAVCVEGTMFALDDCDLHASLVPDLEVCKVHLNIQDTPLATTQSVSYTKDSLCSAISTLSLGYTTQKKNEWCNAIVLLTNITTHAVRFHHQMKFNIYFHRASGGKGICPKPKILGLSSRWNKISKAIRRRGQCSYVFTHYTDDGRCTTETVREDYSNRNKVMVSLIDDKGRTKREKFSRRNDKLDGQREMKRIQRKHREERLRRNSMYNDSKRNEIMKKTDYKFWEGIRGGLHGCWYGSVDTLNYKVASIKCLPRPVQMVNDNGLFVSAKSTLDRLKVVLQVQITSASIPPPVQKIWSKGGAHFREPTPFVQLGSGNFLGSLGATCGYPLQTRMQAQHYNANAAYSGMSDVFRRTLQHESLRGFCMTAMKIWKKVY